MVNRNLSGQPEHTLRLVVDGGLPTWPCSTCKTVNWRKVHGQTVCGECQDYGERLRMVHELESEG
jgi:hypothetical protein